MTGSVITSNHLKPLSLPERVATASQGAPGAVAGVITSTPAGVMRSSSATRACQSTAYMLHLAATRQRAVSPCQKTMPLTWDACLVDCNTVTAASLAAQQAQAAGVAGTHARGAPAVRGDAVEEEAAVGAECGPAGVGRHRAPLQAI